MRKRVEQSRVEWSGVEWSGVEWRGEWRGEWSGTGVEWTMHIKKKYSLFFIKTTLQLSYFGFQ